MIVLHWCSFYHLLDVFILYFHTNLLQFVCALYEVVVGRILIFIAFILKYVYQVVHETRKVL